MLALHAGNGVAFSITGENIPGNISNADRNLSVHVSESKIPKSLLDEKLSGTVANKLISMDSREDFGMVINLHLALASENAGKYANLYRYNEQTGTIEYMGSHLITKEGQAMFGLTGGAELFVTVTDTMPKDKAVAGQYTVVSGDSLSKIALKNGITLRQILAMNPEIRNANKIRPGQKIRVR
jgi:LysM repeat protein